MSKYEPLPQFLASRDAVRVRLDFAAIEKILGFKLPKSAFEYEAWWSNNATGHSHARAWMSAASPASVAVDRSRNSMIARASPGTTFGAFGDSSTFPTVPT